MIRSIAQLGNRLHLLIRPAHEVQAGDSALGLIRRTLADAGIDAKVEETGAGLEDVFVAATGNELMFIQRVFAIARKEVLQLARDRLTFAMIVGIPIIQILLFGYAINLDVRHLRAGVVDEAGTQASRWLIEDLAATPDRGYRRDA